MRIILLIQLMCYNINIIVLKSECNPWLVFTIYHPLLSMTSPLSHNGRLHVRTELNGVLPCCEVHLSMQLLLLPPPRPEPVPMAPAAPFATAEHLQPHSPEFFHSSLARERAQLFRAGRAILGVVSFPRATNVTKSAPCPA